MKLNALISSWFNGSDYSIKRFCYRWPYPKLISELASVIEQYNVSSISDVYKFAYGNQPAIRREVVHVRRQLDTSKKKDRFLRPLFELQDFVRTQFSRKEILGFYVHGSLSTMDYVENYSDFDTLVVVRKEVLENCEWATDFRRRLSKSNTFLYLLDPLQHHRHFVITEFDLAHYFEPIFPLVLFDYATELTDFHEPLNFHIMDAQQYLNDDLHIWEYYFGEVWPKMKRMRSYDVKHAIQSIVFLPVLYSQAKTGSYSYKKFVFDKVCNDFSPEVWSVVERATEVREKCPYRTFYPYTFRKWIGLKLHYKFLHLLHQYFDRDNCAEMLSIMGPEYLAEALELVKEMKDHLCSMRGDRVG